MPSPEHTIPSIEEVLAIASAEEFERVAMEVFAFQARECAPYREYLALIGTEPETVRTVEQIPALPIDFFRTRKVYCAPTEPEIVFTSSSTGGGEPSRHYVAHVSDYRATFRASFERFYPERRSIYALLPNYLQREGSSLVYMVDDLIRRGREGDGRRGERIGEGRTEQSELADRSRLITRSVVPVSGGRQLCGLRAAACRPFCAACQDQGEADSESRGGFYLDNVAQMIDDIRRDPAPKIVLGVSYALWDMAERYDVRFGPEVVVMETGGMKGRREELPRGEFHRLLCDAFGVERIASEYGMAELSSQAYSAGEGVFRAPPWMRVVVRDPADPFEMLPAGRTGFGRTGGVNIIDLGNRYSCAFIQTDDLGRLAADGSFEIVGRIDKSAIRGCNLLIQ